MSLLRTVQLASGFRGHFCVLSGFFDGTACPDEPKFSGVAAYLFDDDGLARYRHGADAIRARMLADTGLNFDIFHATKCCGFRGHAEFHGWPEDVRRSLCRDMAHLAASTRLAGFVALAKQSDFDALQRHDANIAARVGGLYPATVLYVIEKIAAFAKHHKERVFYWLEQGDPRQVIAAEVLTKIGSNEALRERFAYFSHAIVPANHSEAVALAAADQLAWESKRNFHELLAAAESNEFHPDEKLSECFKIMRGNDADKWFETHLSETALAVQSLIKMFYRLP